jgi:hypothetical protein
MKRGRQASLGLLREAFFTWQNKDPLREAFFNWTTALGKILTMDNLRTQYIIVVDGCCMYKRIGEFIDHLLLHCEIVNTLCDKDRNDL